MLEYQLIINPTAGKGRAAKLITRLEGLLRQKGIKYALAVTKSAGHATELAAKAAGEGWPAIAVVGGDGTINEVVNGIAGTATSLAVIPAGTGNDLARSLHLPTTLDASVDILRQPRQIEIDLGVDQAGYFTCIDGIGFPADVMFNVNLSKGVFSGAPAIVWGIFKTMKELKETPVTLELDGTVVHEKVQGVFIMNTVYAGGGLKFSPGADYQDKKLDVLVMRDLSRPEVLALLPQVYRGTHLSHPKVDFYRVSEVNLLCEKPVRKVLDGNVSETTQISAKIASQPLSVLVGGPVK